MIKKILFITLMVSVCGAGLAQHLPDMTRDARMKVLSAKDDTSKINALVLLADLHTRLFMQYKQTANRDSTFLLYNEATRIADGLKRPDKPFWQMIVLADLAEVQCYLGDTINGRKKLLHAAAYFHHQHHSNEELYCWSTLAGVSGYYGKPRDELPYWKVFEKLSSSYKRLDMMLRARQAIISAVADTVPADTLKNLNLALIRDFQHTQLKDLDGTFVQLSYYYRYHGNLLKALTYALGGYDWMVKTKDTSDDKKSTIYGELAEAYQLMGQSAKSIEWYKKTIAVRRHGNMTQLSIYRTAGFLVQEYIKLKQPREALTYITDLARERPPFGVDIEAILWQAKAYCYEALRQFGPAETAYINMMADYNKAGVQGEILHLAKCDIGRFYINRKQYDKAARYIDQRDMINWSALEVKDFHYLLFKIDSAKGNYVSAIQHLNAYKNLTDSIFNSVKSEQISELEIRYATKQKENDIRSLKSEKLLQDQKIRDANNTRNWILTGAGLVSLALLMLYNSFRINRKKSKEIDRKNASLSRLVAEKDELLQEKEWLMKEIHHRVKNNLQIVMGLLQRQSSFIDNKEALMAIRNSEQRMQSIALIHQKLYQSESFMLVSMKPYIDEMILYLREFFDLGEQIKFERSVAELDFEVNIAVSMGLILNEAITNSIKYAFPGGRAGNIRIVLEKLGEQNYLLEIADNGVGLHTAAELDQINSMGFNLMRGLSKQLGGKLNVRNADGLLISINFTTG